MQSPIFRMVPHDTTYLDQRWLDDNGHIKLLPAAEFHSVPRAHLIMWCHRHARFTLPTVELVDWLRIEIGQRIAIEVGAGNGDLGHHLGIKMTDSYIQSLAMFQAALMAPGHRPTSPGPAVERMTANHAVERFRPAVVIASWLTRRFNPKIDTLEQSQSNIFGANEEEIIAGCRTYIHIGNSDSHGHKTALSMPHNEYRYPWLVTRSVNPHNNVIYLWNRRD